jgi:hypothetical protein
MIEAESARRGWIYAHGRHGYRPPCPPEVKIVKDEGVRAERLNNPAACDIDKIHYMDE